MEEDKWALRALQFVSIKLYFEDGTQFAGERYDSRLIILGRSRVEQDLTVP
jgi:hypothetical protein